MFTITPEVQNLYSLRRALKRDLRELRAETGAELTSIKEIGKYDLLLAERARWLALQDDMIIGR